MSSAFSGSVRIPSVASAVPPRRTRPAELRALLRLAAALGAASVLGCDGPAAPDGVPSIVSAVVEEVPAALVRRLDVLLDRPGIVDATYRAAAAAPLRVTSAEPALRHSLTLARLLADQAYDVEVRAGDERGPSEDSHRTGFRTGRLPEGLAGVTFQAEGAPSHALAMLELTRGPFLGFVAVDARGRVVWYHATLGGANGASRRADRSFLLIDEGLGLLEVAPDGRVLARVRQDSASRMIHHDLLETSSGTVLFLAQDWRDARGTRVAGEAIWEWTPETGALLKRWSAWDHLDAEREWGALSVPNDWLHANALSVGPRGNLVMSLHYLNQVLSISPDLARLEWRLGGPAATIQPAEGDRFTGQHTAAEIAPNRVLLFDNGFERVSERYSRAVEFQLDPARGVATKVWEWRPTPDIWSRIVSLARRLPGGNAFVAFGSSAGFVGSSGPVAAYELDPDGRVIWRLTVDGVPLMYRAWPLTDIAGEAAVP